MPRLVLILIIMALFAAGCSTDVEVNAPAQERAVVFALLDPAQSTQYIRIQRGFLNNDNPNALNAAQIKDSIYYRQADELDVRLFDISSTPERELGIFQPIDTTAKDTGIFYAPDQIVWRAKGLNLLRRDGRALAQVRLVIRNRKSNYSANANIALVQPFKDSTSESDASGSLLAPFRNADGKRVLTVNPTTIRFRTEQSGGGIYKAIVRFKILEVNSDGTVDTVRAAWSILPDQAEATNPIDGSVSRNYSNVQRLALLNALVRNLDPLKPVSFRRIVQPASLELYAANNDVREYVLSAQQFSAITQTKPYYSNINNGLGLAGSRTMRAYPVEVSNGAIDSLEVKSQYRQFRFVE